MIFYRILNSLDSGRIGQFMGWDGDRLLLKFESGVYRSYQVKEVEEILPYTVQVKTKGSKVRGENYRVKKGLLGLGATFVWRGTSKILEVTAMDTKDKLASKEITPKNIELVSFSLLKDEG